MHTMHKENFDWRAEEVPPLNWRDLAANRDLKPNEKKPAIQEPTNAETGWRASANNSDLKPSKNNPKNEQQKFLIN